MIMILIADRVADILRMICNSAVKLRSFSLWQCGRGADAVKILRSRGGCGHRSVIWCGRGADAVGMTRSRGG